MSQEYKTTQTPLYLVNFPLIIIERGEQSQSSENKSKNSDKLDRENDKTKNN